MVQAVAGDTRSKLTANQTVLYAIHESTSVLCTKGPIEPSADNERIDELNGLKGVQDTEVCKPFLSLTSYD